MVANLRIQKAEAGESLQIQGKTGLYIVSSRLGCTTEQNSVSKYKGLGI